MTRRTKWGSATWKCAKCGSVFTRIGPESEVMHPEQCHGCAVKFGERTNEHLRLRVPSRKLH